MTFRESDGRIVPLKSGLQPDGMKPSNIGAGKAARLLHDPDRALPVLRDGPSVITRLDQIHQRAVTQPNAVFNNLFSLLNAVNGGEKPWRLAGSGGRLNRAAPKCSVVDFVSRRKAVIMAGFWVKDLEGDK